MAVEIQERGHLGGGDASPPISARLFGHPLISLGERVLTNDAWSRRTARTVLLLLLATPGHRLVREQILETLWPDADPDAAANALYTALYALRRTLEPGGRAAESSYVESRGGAVGLRAHAGLYVDVDAYRRALSDADALAGTARADALREAVAIYVGDLLADEPYTDWPVALRERLRRDWRRAALQLAQLERDAGRPLATVPTLEAVLAVDPTDEAVHQALIQAYAAAGDRQQARRQYARCVAALRNELGAEPSDQTAQVAASIDDIVAAAPQTRARPTLLVPPPPAPPSPLIGRTDEVAAVQRLLDDRSLRLVTIVGPGGVGKTRLVLEVARQVPVGFVSLASVRDPQLVVPTIARSLGLEESRGGSQAEQLREALYGRDLLLVLDNFEHLIDAATDIATVLEGSPGLRIIVTSREALHIRAERVYLLAPLADDAAQLFVDRARAVAPGFALTESTTAVVTEICSRLDGLPLAIELCAARLRHMSLAELRRRLAQTLPVLAGGARDLPLRLRTMADAIGWSYELLGDDEKRMLRSLSVFVGGAHVEAAQAVFSSNDARGILESLADKSLVGLGDRVTLLETIREFAASLVAPEEERLLRDRHATYFLDLAERGAPQLIGPAQREWLERLELEHGNFRAAFDHLVASDSIPEGGLRLARALSRFWRMHGHYNEGRSRVQRALELPGTPTIARARALLTAADLAEPQADFANAEALYREAADVFEQQADRHGLAESAIGLASIHIGRGDLDLATDACQTALTLFREAGDVRGTASAVNYLATIAYHHGDLDRAAELWQECLGLLDRLGDQRARSVALSNLGVLEVGRGEVRRALEHHQAALAIARGLADTYAITHSLANLGHVQVLLGEYDEARSTLEEAIARAREMGDPLRESTALHTLALAALAERKLPEAQGLLARVLEPAAAADDKLRLAGVIDTIAELAVRQGSTETAVSLFGAVDAVRQSTGTARVATEQPGYAHAVDDAAAALGRDRYEEVRAAGRGLSIGDAIEQARRLLTDS